MIGIQLYSLREMAGREGPEAVFRAAAEAGFDGVEFAGFYGLSPEEIGALLQKYNLTAMSAHIGVSALEEQVAALEAQGSAAELTGELESAYTEGVESNG